MTKHWLLPIKATNQNFVNIRLDDMREVEWWINNKRCQTHYRNTERDQTGYYIYLLQYLGNISPIIQIDNKKKCFIPVKFSLYTNVVNILQEADLTSH